MFLTTHNLTDAEKLCQQVAVIRAGKLLAVGAPEALRGRNGSGIQVEIYGSGFTQTLLSQVRARPDVKALSEQNNHLVIEVSSDAAMAPIVSQMVMGGAQIEEVRKNKASLEEIFLDLVEDEK